MAHLTALENRAAALAGPDVLRSPWAPSAEDVKSLEQIPRKPNDALVRAQLEYSADAPLHVTVYTSRPDDCAHALYDRSWAAVRQQSNRWRTAQIMWHCSSGWLDASVLALPTLEELTIYDPHGKIIPFFANAPDLRTAEVLGFDLAPCPQPWKLTSLTLGNVSPADATPVLQQLSQTLQSLYIRPLYRDHTTSSHRTPISLPELSFLGFGSLNQCQAFCPLLIVPMLEELTLDMSDFTAATRNADEHIVEMLHRSLASVTDLSICDLNAASSQCILRLLKGLPTLESLNLSADSGHEPLDEQFFLALTPTAENPDCPLPNLVELAVTASIVDDPACMDFATLQQMFNALRREDVTINDQLYPALEERSLMRNPGDDVFAAYDSDDDDEEYIPDPTDTDNDTDYSTDVSDDSNESQSDLEIFGTR